MPGEQAEAKKDRVIFMSEEEAAVPSKIVLESGDDDSPPGLILPSGEINWNCPCLGGMAVGPCGVEFREAFTCFHYSTADPKGSECIEKFAEMQKCMQSFPELFEEKRGKFTDDEDDESSKKPDSADANKESKASEEISVEQEAKPVSSADTEPRTEEPVISSESNTGSSSSASSSDSSNSASEAVSSLTESLDSVKLESSGSS